MNRDTIIGFVLIAVVLIGFSWWNQPSAEQVEAARKQDSIAAIQKDSAQKAVQQAAAQKAVADSSVAVQADTTALFYQALQGTAKKVVLKNGKLTLTLNTKGGTIELRRQSSTASRASTAPTTLRCSERTTSS